jgi:hypothetical protein
VFCRFRFPSPFGSLAGRSGGEKGDRLLFIANSLRVFFVWSGALPLGGNPRPPPSGGGGAVESFCDVASAWCRRLPHLNFEASPSNKLKAGRTLDLVLGFSAAPSSVLRQGLASSTSPLSACHGGEGKGGGCGSPCSSSGERVSGAEGAPYPRAITSPARGPMLPTALGTKVLASCPAVTHVFSPAGGEGFLLRALLFCLPPPVCGRFD